MEVVLTEREINSLLEWDELMWRQRSRQIWLKNGYRNSRFFQTKANGRRRSNHIPGLMDDNQTW